MASRSLVTIIHELTGSARSPSKSGWTFFRRGGGRGLEIFEKRRGIWEGSGAEQKSQNSKCLADATRKESGHTSPLRKSEYRDFKKQFCLHAPITNYAVSPSPIQTEYTYELKKMKPTRTRRTGRSWVVTAPLPLSQSNINIKITTRSRTRSTLSGQYDTDLNIKIAPRQSNPH